MIYQKLKEILSPVEKPVVVEIGAHIGTDTTKLCKMLRSPYKYFAVEPDSRNFEKLRPVCEEYDAIFMPFAFGAKTDFLPFWYSSGDNGKRTHTDSNSLKKPIDTPKRPAFVTFEKGKTLVFRLDIILSAYLLNHIDLIWMDVQGAELDVFEGGKEALKITRYIYTECQEGRYKGQPGLSGILEALPDWEMVLKNGDNVLLRNTKC